MQFTGRFLTLIIACVSLSVSGRGQGTMVNNDPDADFKLAKELYQKNQFSLAFPLFRTLAQETGRRTNLPVSTELELKYYSIVCGLKLNDETLVKPAIDFIALEHAEPRTEMMSFHLAEYYFRQQKYPDAAAYYDKTNIANLSNREVADMKFHLGYSYFTMQQLEKAYPLFNTIRQIPGDPNYMDANYYYGFLSFYDKNYPEALSAFKIVEGQPTYQNIVPYYVAQIYYFNGDKVKAATYAATALKRGGQYYDLQMKQLVGHIYFEEQEFEKALPFLEQYVSATEKVRREDLYELSYCYYVTKQYNKAISGFKELGGKEDSLAQNSMYMLADSYLKTNQKNSARNAFLFCALNSSNAAQKEISQFNYGKLSYELGYTNVALSELQKFITTYPKSTDINEARELLVTAMANSNQYKEALALIRDYNIQTASVRKVYPKILYGRAAEMINDQQLNSADSILNLIMVEPNNEELVPYVRFWKGEIAFRNNMPDSAVHYFTRYFDHPATNGEVNLNNAHYSLGYAYMREDAYQNALQQFGSIVSAVNRNSSPIEQDAYLRIADSYFMLKNYTRALQMYDIVLNNDLQGADYALYQKAVISGASNRNNEKLALLQSLSQRFPSSSLVGDAYMEMANTYLSNENYREAIKPLNSVLAAKNAEGLKPQAYLKLGVAYFNQDDNANALTNFQKLISTYPNSQESDQAVEYVRNIFIGTQRPAEFVNFMRQNGKQVSYSEEDSLSYVSSNMRYESKDYENALKGFESYTRQFPQGKYFVEANYNAAVIYNTRKDFPNALKYYSAVAEKAPNKYAEQSVLQAARISYFELKNYTAAQQYFNLLKSIATTPENKLEAMRGLLRTQFKLSQWTEAVANAQDLLTQKGIAADDRMMANLVIGKNYQQSSQFEEALSAYRSVVALGKSEFSAEARYHIAEILMEQNKLPDAEKAAFEVINKAGSYDVWITKSYILLGEIYFREKDYFNAEATLKSVVENATDAGFKKEAQDKLDIVVAEKNRNSKVEQ